MDFSTNNKDLINIKKELQELVPMRLKKVGVKRVIISSLKSDLYLLLLSILSYCTYFNGSRIFRLSGKPRIR